MIDARRLREHYLSFFMHEGHAVIPASSLIPENDPTVLFTTAGMHPLVPYLLGQEHPDGTRLVNCQPCIRTGDIDAVGDETHLTFFEMLGNWSLGDYFKREAIAYSYRFLTDRAWLGLDRQRLAITVFAGEEGIPRDTQAAQAWNNAGIPHERIHYLGREHNWWGPAGKTGPCGPDSEMFYDIDGKSAQRGAPGDDRSGYIEIWNDVFMQYHKNEHGEFHPLQRTCVDTGMGVERTVATLQGKSSVYETELFTPIFAALEEHCHITYGRNTKTDRSLRIIADHIKAAIMIIIDEHDIIPSNLGQGYIARRLIRRAVRHGMQLGITGAFLDIPARGVFAIYADQYPALRDRQDRVYDILRTEETLFGKTLRTGQHMFEKECARLTADNSGTLPGTIAFHLYDTYGFPLELTMELAAEKGLTVDRASFDRAFEEHRQKSQASAGTFRGGLADHSQQTTALHTATHLLHQALRMTLGAHVQQKGSNITAERLRFDFSHGAKMSAAEIEHVERIVNEQIERHLPIVQQTMPLADAQKQGALAFFTDKYSHNVSTYRIGDFSFEVCGGPHAHNTAELGRFTIIKEQASAQGIRRIKATLTPPKPLTRE